MSEKGARHMTVHRPTISQGSAPGGLYVRVCSDSGTLLAEHPLNLVWSADGVVDAIGSRDADLAFDWADTHPGDTVRAYIYDGDTGRCGATIIVDNR